MSTKESKQLKWGYTKIGHLPTLPVAIAIGSVAAITIAAAKILSNPPGPHRWAAVIILAVFLAGPLSGLAAVLLVDRKTMPGTVRRPEVSVESQWSAKAAQTGFQAMIMACGLGLVFLPSYMADAVVWTLLTIMGVGSAAFALSYLLHRTR